MVFVIEYVFDAYLNSSVFVKSVFRDVMLVLSLFSCKFFSIMFSVVKLFLHLNVRHVF